MKAYLITPANGRVTATAVEVDGGFATVARLVDSEWVSPVALDGRTVLYRSAPPEAVPPEAGGFWLETSYFDIPVRTWIAGRGLLLDSEGGAAKLRGKYWRIWTLPRDAIFPVGDTLDIEGSL